MKKVVLYGASGHGKVIAEIAEESGFKIFGFLDDNINIHKILDYLVFNEMPKSEVPLAVILSIGNNFTRKKIAESHPELIFTRLIAPHANISKRATIKEGTVVMSGVTVNSCSEIGKHCIINTNASIDHDCFIGDFVHISPNAALAGNVSVGEGTHIGIGTSVIQGVKIGKWCMIGAGAVIIRDVPDGVTVVGNPGKIIRK